VAPLGPRSPPTSSPDGGPARRRADAVLPTATCRAARRPTRGRRRVAAFEAGQEASNPRRCLTARIPAISPAPAAATPSPTCLARRGLWRRWLWARESESGPFDTAGSGAAAFEARPAKSPIHRRRVGAPLTTGRNSPGGCRRRVRAARCRHAAGKVLTTSARQQAASSRGAAAAPPATPVGRAASGVQPATSPMWRSAPHFTTARCTRGHRARDPASRGADPASRAQPPWLLHDHMEETGRGRVPPRRHAKAQKGAARTPSHHHVAENIGQNSRDPEGPAGGAACWPSLDRRGFAGLLRATSSAPSPTASVWACGRRPSGGRFTEWKQLVACSAVAFLTRE